MSTLRKASYEPGLSYLERAHNILSAEFIRAICEDPNRMVRTPAWNCVKWPAVEEFREQFDETEGIWLQLAIMVGRVADGKMDQMTHLLGKAILASVADKTAKWHGDNLAEQLEEEDEK